MTLGLKQLYDTEASGKMIKKFGYKNKMEIPKLDKIVINRGVGEAVSNPKAMEIAVSELALITGQQPLITKAKKSIATYKIREKQAIGCKVTLRGRRMYEFLHKFINICLPKIRDFRGVSAKSFDGRGNYSIGITEQLIFPEIDYDKVDKARGMDITICTSAKTDDEAKTLLEYLGMPFRS